MRAYLLMSIIVREPCSCDIGPVMQVM